MAQDSEYDPFQQHQDQYDVPYDPFQQFDDEDGQEQWSRQAAPGLPTEPNRATQDYQRQQFPAPPDQYAPTPRTSPNTGINGGRTTYDTQPVTLPDDTGAVGPSSPTFNGNRRDEAWIRSNIAQWAALPGADPTLRTGPDYWVRRILETGGLGPDNTKYWQDMGLYNYRRPPGYHGSGGSGGQTPGGSPASNPELDAAIRRLLARGETPISADDPSIAGQFLSVRNALERNAQITRAQAAQRAAVQGGNVAGSGGALEGEMNSIQEGVGDQEGRLMAELIGNELQARRQEVVNALGLAQGQQKIALQAYLAEIDRQLQQQRIDAQRSQWQDEFDYRWMIDEYDRNRGYQEGLD